MNPNILANRTEIPRSRTPLHAYTALAFLVNRIIDAGPLHLLAYDDVFDAARESRLLPLLAERYGHQADFTWVTYPNAATLHQMETTLRNAAATFEGRVGRATGPLSGLCLVQSIILEAIQREFHRSQLPSPDEPHPYLPFLNRTRAGWPPSPNDPL